ncbi:MAG: hypothetical protein ACOY40_15900 [Bacillota bacterium]
MFFRVVNARYKEREYTYLKLLESHRHGDKIKHKQVVNLSNINHLPADRIKPLFDDLNRTLAVFRDISESAPPSCRYLKTSYLLALENAFNVSQHYQDQDLKEIILLDQKRKYNYLHDNILFELVSKKALEYGISSDLFCWVENITGCLVCFLMDSTGFPLKFIVLDEQREEEITNTLGLIIKDRQPGFFLATACERLYNSFQLLELMEKEKSYIVKEIFLVKQLTNWPGRPDVIMEKILLCGSASEQKDEKISGALLAVISLKDHIAYVNSRVDIITGGPLSARDLACTYFISLFFKKMFDVVMVRHAFSKKGPARYLREEL